MKVICPWKRLGDTTFADLYDQEFILEKTQEISKQIGFPGLYQKLTFKIYKRWPKEFSRFGAVALCQPNEIRIRGVLWDRLGPDSKREMLAHEICHHAAWLKECPLPHEREFHTRSWQNLMRKAGYKNAGLQFKVRPDDKII